MSNEWLKLFPLSRAPESQSLASLVTVCRVESRWVQVRLWPALIVMELGVNAKSLIETVVAPPELLAAALVGAADERAP